MKYYIFHDAGNNLSNFFNYLESNENIEISNSLNNHVECGLEPPTSRLTAERASQLRHKSSFVT
ncbi:hypothetical protein BCR32DRAFT_286255 [Anaeromyces robustus]|uniref:Uncharacterized protein n=1 Tax=Anaeromyces robustus TaxID=1754192 RepID=A0A1Y1W193_9FUNG|nr:hypothetical protein BCR32DRAFT_286255 [Anaeromyces robustus]|eukprot:ORX66996.1 hypothetical protein BCR32DRAFT_286255 [Anaeromyces robustus]